MLQIGDRIPLDIQIKNDQGEEVTLKHYLNNYLIIYFYPEAMTPSCTVEACGFRDSNSEIEQMGATIVGISPDPVKKLQKFKTKENLNFTFLSDEDHKLLEAFGTWGEKTMFGRTFMGTLRSTFIADKNGTIIKVWEKVTSEGHAEEVLEFLKNQSL